MFRKMACRLNEYPIFLAGIFIFQYFRHPGQNNRSRIRIMLFFIKTHIKHRYRKKSCGIGCKKSILIAGCSLCLFLALPWACHGQNVFFHEKFEDLDSWESLKFRKIERLTHYEITKINNQSTLKIQTENSASGLVFKTTYDLARYPLIEWRWKIENIIQKGDAREKSGDDYPVRIYVLFAYDASKVDFFEKARYEAAKLFYGEYPPLAGINYIWANRIHSQKIIPNAYTSKVMMIISDSGSEYIGKWRTHRVNVIDDFKAAFGRELASRTVSLAIMGDSDNTGESAVSYIDYIKVFNDRLP